MAEIEHGYAEKFLDVLLAYIPKREKIVDEEAKAIMKLLHTVCEQSSALLIYRRSQYPIKPTDVPRQ
jgi:hypothetical protein